MEGQGGEEKNNWTSLKKQKMSSNILLKSVGAVAGFATSLAGYYFLIAEHLYDSHTQLMDRMDQLDRRLSEQVAAADSAAVSSKELRGTAVDGR